MGFKDHFSEQAQQYTRFRPTYPTALYEYLASLCSQRQMAWDCATGNGQAALGLNEYFAEVVATDPSSQQIKASQPHPHVQYLVSTAEHCPLPSSSVDLITVAQALHWFDRSAFYAESRRVARPDAWLAAWCYAGSKVTEEIDEQVVRLSRGLLSGYWPVENQLIDEGYQTIDFPFPEHAAPQFRMVVEWKLSDLIGYLGTWSAVRRYIRERGSDPVAEIGPALTAAWGEPWQVREVAWPLSLRVGKVHG